MKGILLKNKCFLGKDTKERGITLIALVITIIVLLILAGVTIAMLMGDNGILTKAREAKNDQDDATVKESTILLWNEYQLEKKSVDSGKVKETVQIASTEITKIQGAKINYLATTATTFWDFLLLNKEVIDADGVINVEKLTGQTLDRGNGTDGVIDVYKIKLDEENNLYTLKYYGKAEEEAKILWEIEDKNSTSGAGDIVEPENPDEWEYDVQNGLAILTKYKGDAENLIVPNYINGIRVKQVGNGTNLIWDETNTDCVDSIRISSGSEDEFQVKIKNVTISEGIEIIASNSFFNILNMKEVQIPASVNTIEAHAFDTTFFNFARTGFTLNIPDTVINLGEGIVGRGDTIAVEFNSADEIPDTWDVNWAEDSENVIYGVEM